jgi:NADH dehydrogenase
MRVLLVGGSGFLGSYVLPLLNKKFDLYLLVRDKRKVGNSIDLIEDAPLNNKSKKGVSILKGDISDRESLKALKDYKFDAIVNLAGIIHEKEQSFIEVHYTGVKNLLEISGSIIHVSALWAKPDGNPYQVSKWLGEQAIRQMAENYVILRPSVMFGIGDGFIHRIYKIIKSYPFIPLIKGMVSPVFAGDVAKEIMRLLEKLNGVDETGKIKPIKEIKPLCGPQTYSIPEVFQIIADAAGIKRIRLPIPVFFLKVYSHLSELKDDPDLPKVFISMIEERIDLDCQKCETDFESFVRDNIERIQVQHSVRYK